MEVIEEEMRGDERERESEEIEIGFAEMNGEDDVVDGHYKKFASRQRPRCCVFKKTAGKCFAFRRLFPNAGKRRSKRRHAGGNLFFIFFIFQHTYRCL